MWQLTESLLKRKLFVLFFFKLYIYLIVFGKITNAVLPEYCLRPLNISDCNLKPTLVFSYYKPGSRCEIKSWKGCPTLNKFKDEYECSNMCIGRLWDNADNAVPQSIRDETEDGIDDYVNLCIENLNTSKCSNIETTVFTYNLENETCTSIKYYGCGGNNIFDSMESCKETCSEKNELKDLPVSEIEKLAALISNLNVNTDIELSESEKSKVKKDKNNEKSSENSDKNIESQIQITAGNTNTFASNSGDDLTSITYYTTSNAGKDLASNTYTTSNAGKDLASNTYTTSNAGKDLASNTYTTSNAGKDLALNTYTTSNAGKDLASNTYITSSSSDASTSTDKMYSKVTKQDSTTTSTQLTTTMSTLTSNSSFKFPNEIIIQGHDGLEVSPE